jgi:ankyrin repeat protein
MEHKHEAAVEVLLQAMIAAGMDIDARYEGWNKQVQTLLMRASALGLASVVSNLLVLGADVSATDWNNKHPIDHAANEDVKAAFAKHLAQVDITDQNKNGLLLVFSRHGMASRLPAVLQAGADLKHTDENGNTCLHLAVEQGSIDIVRILVEAGADLTAKNKVQVCVCVCVKRQTARQPLATAAATRSFILINIFEIFL